MSATSTSIIVQNRRETLFFLCDIQSKFRYAIHGFDQVVDTANKMLRIAKILECQVVVTEQNPKALGTTAPEIDLRALGPLHIGSFEKTCFSMLSSDVHDILRRPVHAIVLFGIEAHVCVLQTALELLDRKYTVYVLADGVSSCNKQEVPYALDQIRQAGGYITTSESITFQLMRDAADPTFKAFSAIIKEEKEKTKKAAEILMQCPSFL